MQIMRICESRGLISPKLEHVCVWGSIKVEKIHESLKRVLKKNQVKWGKAPNYLSSGAFWLRDVLKEPS